MSICESNSSDDGSRNIKINFNNMYSIYCHKTSL